MLSRLLSELRYRLRAIFRRSDLERDLDDELRFHLDQEVQKLRREGVGELEATRRARLALGGIEVTKEADRDARGVAALEHLARDARVALRAVRRNPGFALVAVLTLALGIGANTAIFSVVDAVLLRPLPYRDADRLVSVTSRVRGMPEGAAGSGLALSYPDYRDIGTLTGAIAGIAAYRSDRYNFTNTDQPRELQVTTTTADLFPVLGVSPVVGHAFGANETHAPLAIISHNLWISSFGGDRSALGRLITLDDTSFTIVGVMPAGFAFPEAGTDVWIPIGWALSDPALAELRMYRVFSTVARLAPEASLDRLRGALDLLGQRVTASGEATSKLGSGERFVATRLRDAIVGDARQPLLILLGAVALVLLIACVNAANLLLARANARAKEFAVRRALGAGRGALVRQLLVESVLLALGAALVGLGLAGLGLHLLASQLPHGYAAGIDARALGFTVLLAVATGLGFGVAPALRASVPVLEQSLRDGPGGTLSRPRRRARDVLVVSEVALALVLLVGSALLVRSFIALSAVNPGFDQHGLLAARIRLTPARYATASRKRTFYDDLLQRLRAQPGVGAITIANGLPLAGVNTVGMNPQRIRPDDPNQFLEIAATSVGADYFATMRIPILQGRAFTAQDREDSKPVCVVSQALAWGSRPFTSPSRSPGTAATTRSGSWSAQPIRCASSPRCGEWCARKIRPSRSRRSRPTRRWFRRAMRACSSSPPSSPSSPRSPSSWR
jgi:predicted permease